MQSGPQITRLVTGMSRAGTTWVARVLNTHSRVAAYGESRFFARCYVAPNRRGLYDASRLQQALHSARERILDVTIGDSAGCLNNFKHRTQKELIDSLAQSLQPPVSPGELFSAIGAAIARHQAKDVFVEKTPQHTHFRDRIEACLPDYRMLVLVRDPCEFVLSYKHQGDRKDDYSRQRFAALYHPIVTSLVWRSYAVSAISATADGRHCLVIRFEDLKADPQAGFARIQSFFELPQEEIAGNVSPANTSFPAGERPRLSDAERYWVGRISAGAAVRLGYETQAANPGWRSAAAHCASLPVWALRNVTMFRGKSEGGTGRYVQRLLARMAGR